jgi:hypothetical protein
MADESVGLIVTSIPFSNHYEYTPAYEDFGFTERQRPLLGADGLPHPAAAAGAAAGPDLRCHVKDRILFGNVTGAGVPTSSPFHAEAIMHGRRTASTTSGWSPSSPTSSARTTRPTGSAGRSSARTARRWASARPSTSCCSTSRRPTAPEGLRRHPVVKDKDDYTRARWQVDAHAFWRSSGDRHLTPDELARWARTAREAVHRADAREVYDYESHVRIGEALDGRGALPSTFMALAPGSHHPMVWHDVNRMRTLNGEQSQRGLDAAHLPAADRHRRPADHRYSNEGDLVLDPFSGLGTVPVRALALGRRGLGVELNGGYFLDAVKYLEAEERKHAMPRLFDTLSTDDQPLEEAA